MENHGATIGNEPGTSRGPVAARGPQNAEMIASIGLLQEHFFKGKSLSGRRKPHFWALRGNFERDQRDQGPAPAAEYHRGLPQVRSSTGACPRCGVAQGPALDAE